MRLRARGHDVEIANAQCGHVPPPQDYDAVILGSRVQHGHHAREIVEYARQWRPELERMPTAFFSVSLAADVPFLTHDPGHHVQQLVEESGWRPDYAASYGRIGEPQAWKLADLVTVSLAEHPVCNLSPRYGPI